MIVMVVVRPVRIPGIIIIPAWWIGRGRQPLLPQERAFHRNHRKQVVIFPDRSGYPCFDTPDNG
jgi:hypothetical protein